VFKLKAGMLTVLVGAAGAGVVLHLAGVVG